MKRLAVHKIRYVNLLLIVTIVAHFFITFGVYKWISSTDMAYALQVLLLVLPIICGICLPAVIYIIVWSKLNHIGLRETLIPEKNAVKPNFLKIVYVILFALLTYTAVCYFNFAIRGVVQYFTKELAIKQIAFGGGVAGILLSVVVLAGLPALVGEFLNKKIVVPAYSGTGGVFSFLIPVLLSVVFYTDIQTILFRLCYAGAAMLVYRKTNNFLLSALFMFFVLLPDAISGGGVWLPLDYRTTLAVEESLINGLFAFSVAIIALIGWFSLYHFVFFYEKTMLSGGMKPDYYDVLSIFVIPFVCLMMYMLNIYFFHS